MAITQPSYPTTTEDLVDHVGAYADGLGVGVPAGTDGQILGYVGTTPTALDVDAAVAATDIPFTPTGTVAATDTQTAIAEVATDAATALTAGLADKADKSVTLNAQTGTSYTLVLTDAGKLVTVSNAATHTLTVPLNSSVAYPTGTVINVARLGAGAVNVAATGGVTISSPGAVLGLRAQYSQATLIKTAADTWLLAGDIA